MDQIHLRLSHLSKFVVSFLNNSMLILPYSLLFDLRNLLRLFSRNSLCIPAYFYPHIYFSDSSYSYVFSKYIIII